MLGDFGEVYVLDWGLAKIQGSAGGAAANSGAAHGKHARSASPESAHSDSAEQPGADDVTATMTPINSAQPAVAAMSDSVNTAEGQVVGTLAYMSPEQSQPETETLDARSDVYTLGVILFEILTLERMRPRGNPDVIFAAIREGFTERPSIRAPHRDIPPELDEIFLHAVQHAPEKRYQSARALHLAIEGYLSGERDIALRRDMAAQHTSLAAIEVERALSGGPDSEEARRTALTEVGKAMALDPANGQAMALLRRILSEPPRQVPAEVETMVKADLAARERLRLRTLALSGSAALVMIPLLLFMGVRDWPLMLMLVLFSVLNIGLRWWVSNPTTPLGWRYVSQLASLALMFCFGRILGPLLFMTVPLTVHTVVHAISAQAALRRFVLLTSCGLLFGMVALERFGVLARSYHFAGDTLVISSNLVHLSPALTLVLLLSISVLYLLLPALALSRLPDHLAEAERRLAVHAWQLRQLIPEPSSSSAASRRSLH